MIPLPKVVRPARETPLVKQILRALNRTPGVWASQNVVGLFYDMGGTPRTVGLGTSTPDVFGILTLAGPRFPIAQAFALEVKTWKGRNSHPEVQEGQMRWRRLAERRGFACGKVTSVEEAAAAVAAFRVEFTRRIAVLG